MKWSNFKGYTLVEMMSAMAVGLIGVAAVATTLGAGMIASTDSRSQLYAVNSLREEMETLRRISFDTLIGYGATSSFTNDQLTKLQSGRGSRTLVSATGNDIRQVVLTVTWRGRSGRTLSQSLTTLVTRKGLNGA